MSDSTLGLLCVITFIISYFYLCYYFIMLRAPKYMGYLDSLIRLTSANMVHWRKWKFKDYPWEWVGELPMTTVPGIRYHFYINDKPFFGIMHKPRFLHVYRIPEVDDYGQFGERLFYIGMSPAHKLKTLEDAIIKQVGSNLPPNKKEEIEGINI